MRYRYQSRDKVYEVDIARSGSEVLVTVDGQRHPVEVLDEQPGQLTLRFAGRPVTIYWAAEGSRRWLSLTGCAYQLEPPAPRRSAGHAEGQGETVRAPMPAQVRAVQVQAGDTVEKGQTLLLLEAMKMEIRIKAPAAGRVNRLLVSAGQAVDKDQQLVELGE